MWKTCSILLVLGVVGLAQRRNYSSFVCPAKCVCFRRTVRCMQLELTEVPKVPLPTVLLDLRFNKIKEIRPGTFKGQKHIRSLLLNNNLIETLRSGVFTGLVQLKHLYLYKNRIKHIDSDVFQGLPKLEHLYLHNNDLEEFKDGTFSNIPQLNRLFLYNNRISHIPSGAFRNLPNLKRLRLDQNALVCDCRIAWLSKMLNDNSLHVAANCKYPQEMYGKPLRGMSPEDFHCKPPEIMSGPEDVEISWGGTAIFTCKVSGDPPPSIYWMRNDEELKIDHQKYEMAEDGSLMVKDTRDEDIGHYECMAKNPDGEAKSRPARMIVKNQSQNIGGYGSPVFVVTPSSVSTTDGVPEIKLDCRAVGIPQPRITWSFNGIQLIPSPKHLVNNDGSLVIRQVRGSDHGTYRCTAQNSNGRISAEANVVINVAPIFTVHPENTETTIGSTIRLECVAVGTPPPEITWFKDDLELRSDNNRILISQDGSYLEIKHVKESDAALYVCEARNSLGYREVSAKVKIATKHGKAPKFVFKPYNIEAVVGTTIELPCKAEGDPSPGIQWQKDGSGLQRTGRTKVSLTGNLYIHNVSPEDQGRYECSAINDVGRATASGYVTVKNIENQNFAVGDKFVRVAFAEATQEIDKAINKTIDNLFHNKGPHGSADLFRLVRFPDAPARELARAAEVYERTLVNIRKHIEKGMTMNNTSVFNYREILSRDHLDLVAQLSGCMTHRLKSNCSDMCFHSKYRSIDGTCNNLQNPTWGASLTAFRRILKPIYENGFSTPIGWDKNRKYYGFPKPSSRLVSTTLIATDKITSDDEITHMVMQWGQFLDHDLDHAIPSVSSESWDGIDCKKSCDYAAPCYPMDVPKDDPRVKNRRCIDFIRSSAICGSGMTSVFFDDIQSREQINQLTSFIDASQVYGFSEELAKDLRDLNGETGRLREGAVFPGRKPLLPYTAGNQGVDCRRNLSESTVNCFVAGDIRANEQAGLIAMHTLWMREHNRIARELKILNPQWDGNTTYHEARKIVGAAMQHITYKHWLPFVLGEEGMKMLGEYKEYNPLLHPSISNVFATAALRFGHTLINPVLHRLDWDFKPIREGHLPLRFAFFSPWRVVDEGGIDPLLRGLFTVAAKVKKPDENLNTELTEQLFRTAHAVALDLAAMNIHRSRDHAIPGYLEFRRVCEMSPVETFDDLKQEISDPNVRRKLQELYGHPGNIDVFVGGILEDVVEGGRVGPLFRCLLIEQFKRLRDGDRFYYENPSVFKPEQLVQIKQYSLSRVLCENGDNITRITRNAFVLPELQDGFVKCDVLPKVDLRHWFECCNDCRYTGQLNTISRLNTRSRRHLEFDNSTVNESNFENEKKLKNKIVKLEKDLQELRSTVKEMDRIIKKLDKG